MKIIQENTFEKARKAIRESKEEPIIFSSNDDDLNRKVMEKENIDLILINLSGRKDYQKQRNSGFNQVLSRIAKKKKISIGINFDELVESMSSKEIILSRIIQNIKLCNKNKLQMKFIIQKGKNNRNKQGLKSLGLVLGMPTWMTKEL